MKMFLYELLICYTAVFHCKGAVTCIGLTGVRQCYSDLCLHNIRKYKIKKMKMNRNLTKLNLPFIK